MASVIVTPDLSQWCSNLVIIVEHTSLRTALTSCLATSPMIYRRNVDQNYTGSISSRLHVQFGLMLLSVGIPPL